MEKFIGNVIRMGTISLSPVRQTALSCLKNKGKNKCHGWVKISRQDIPIPQINWSCNKCETGGTVTGWQDSISNLNEFMGDFSNIKCYQIILTSAEYHALLETDFFEPTCEKIVLLANPMVGGIILSIPEDDLEYFMENLAQFANHEKRQRVANLLDTVFDKLMELSDLLEV